MKCQYLDLVPVKRIPGFWPSEKCKDKIAKFMAVCQTGHKK